MLDKSTIRKQMLAKRQALSEVARAQAAQAIIPKLLAEISVEACVAGYRAIRGELDVTPSLQALFLRGNRLCLPVIEGKESPLVFHAWQPDAPLVKGSYAIEIPAGGRAVTPDYVIVPLVACDSLGHRIGYGAGYYDAAIRALRQAQKTVTFVGVGYGFQIVAHIPAEPHDERLDKVITVL